MLLFDQRTSFDWMKIERRNDEKDRKNSWNELSEWWFWNNQKEEEHFFEDVNSMY
jgi:hypothetical protein